jgi:hypothetical protein
MTIPTWRLRTCISVVMDSQKFARPNPRIAAVVLGARTTISMALNL